MVDKYPAQDQDPFSWTSAGNDWSVLDDNAKDQAAPLIGEDTFLTVNSATGAGGVVALDVTTPALNSLDSSGFLGTLAMAGVFDVDVNGAGTLVGVITGAAGNVISISGTVDLSGLTSISSGIQLLFDGTQGVTSPSGVELPDVVVAGAAVTLVNTMEVDNFEVSAGGFIQNSQDLLVSGDCKITGGGWTGGVVQLVGTGTQVVKNGAYADRWTDLNVSATSDAETSLGSVGVNKLSGSGIVSGASILYVYFASSDSWVFTGTCTAPVYFTSQVNVSNAVAISINAALLIRGANFTLTMAAALSTLTNTLTVASQTAGAVAGLDMGTDNSLTVGGLVIGEAVGASTKSGDVDLGSGKHSIGSGGIVGGDAGNAAGNVLNFATSILLVDSGATIDGDNIDTLLNTRGLVRGGCTIANVDLTGQGQLDARGCVDAGSPPNVNVLFGPLTCGRRTKGYGG